MADATITQEETTEDETQPQWELAECTAEFSDMSIMLIRTLRPMPSQIEEAK